MGFVVVVGTVQVTLMCTIVHSGGVAVLYKGILE